MLARISGDFPLSKSRVVTLYHFDRRKSVLKPVPGPISKSSLPEWMRVQPSNAAVTNIAASVSRARAYRSTRQNSGIPCHQGLRSVRRRVRFARCRILIHRGSDERKGINFSIPSASYRSIDCRFDRLRRLYRQSVSQSHDVSAIGRFEHDDDCCDVRDKTDQDARYQLREAFPRQ